jgi:hypothetical protein
MSQPDVLGTAGIDTSPLSVTTPTSTVKLSMPTSTLPGNKDTEHNLIMKKLDELKTIVNDGFSHITVKMNEIGLKQTGGRLTRKNGRSRSKNKKIR